MSVLRRSFSKMTLAQNCIFCKIIRGEIPSHKVILSAGGFFRVTDA